MKNRIYLLFHCWILMWVLPSCSEIFEEPIDTETVELLSPGENLETSVYLQTFLWDALENALSYRLQIASPSFDSVAFFAVDTTMEGTHFELTLAPGQYQWRVRALNGSSMTNYSVRNLTVHEASISQQAVQLLAPGDQLVTKQSSLLFEWGKLFGAERYRLQVDTNNFSDEEEIFFENVLPDSRFNFEAAKERTYQWRVRAESDTAQSKWSVARIFTVDQTPPAPPLLTSPANNQQLGKPVNLQWQSSEEAMQYRLFVYKSDSTTLYNSNFPVALSKTSYSLNAGERNERIYWRVTSLDRAGNESDFSDYRSFIIQ